MVDSPIVDNQTEVNLAITTVNPTTYDKSMALGVDADVEVAEDMNAPSAEVEVGLDTYSVLSEQVQHVPHFTAQVSL